MSGRFPHVFTLLFYVTCVCAALTWVVPSGSFARNEVTLSNGMTRNLVVPGSFETVPKHVDLGAAFLGGDVPEGHAAPASVLDLLASVPRGLEEAADIIFFIFVIGAAFGILQRTGVIVASLHALLERYRAAGPVVVVILMVLMGIGGSTLGMGEEFIPLVPVFLMLSRELGYDRVFGVAVVNVAAMIGFAAATTNPFTVAIAQSIAELPIAGGLGFRMLFFVVCMSLGVRHVLAYGIRVHTHPETSLVADLPDRSAVHEGDLPAFTRAHAAILAASFLGFAGIMACIQLRGWWMAEMGGGFLGIGLVAAAIARLSPRETTEAAVHGLQEMVVAALVVGVARAIVVVLEGGMILDTLVHVAAGLLEGLPPMISAQGMLLFQTSFNVFVPSGSGQAAVTMPLMAPLADLVGVSREAAVFAFQCGDGMSNMIIPTSGTLMAMLLMADVPYERWLRFAGPLFLQLLVASGIFLGLAVAGGL